MNDTQLPKPEPQTMDMRAEMAAGLGGWKKPTSNIFPGPDATPITEPSEKTKAAIDLLTESLREQIRFGILHAMDELNKRVDEEVRRFREFLLQKLR